MALTPRKSEWEAVARLLEPEGWAGMPKDELDDFTALCKQVVKSVWTEFSLREQQHLVLWSLSDQDPWAAYGMFSGQGDAERWVRTLPTGIARVLPVASAAGATQLLAQMERDAEDRFGDAKCARCDHRRWQHGAVKANGKPDQIKPGAPRCAVSCDCAKYVTADEYAKELGL